MLAGVDPLLRRIEALSEPGCYLADFDVAGGQQRSIVLRVEAGAVNVPEANLIAGWASDSESFRLAATAVLAVDLARRSNATVAELLRDVAGGWDVGLGNVLLSPAGHPTCGAHGDLELIAAATYECATCGARALLGDPATHFPAVRRG